MGIYWTEEQQTLVNIFELIDKNNSLIASMNKVHEIKFSYFIEIPNKLGKLTLNLKKSSFIIPVLPTILQNPKKFNLDPKLLMGVYFLNFLVLRNTNFPFSRLPSSKLQFIKREILILTSNLLTKMEKSFETVTVKLFRQSFDFVLCSVHIGCRMDS